MVVLVVVVNLPVVVAELEELARLLLPHRILVVLVVLVFNFPQHLEIRYQQ